MKDTPLSAFALSIHIGEKAIIKSKTAIRNAVFLFLPHNDIYPPPYREYKLVYAN
jgi:hypothetical protein